MDELVENARTKIGNMLFLIGKYPEKILYHQPWLASDPDVLEHLKKNSIKVDENQVEFLSKDIIKVSCVNIIFMVVI